MSLLLERVWFTAPSRGTVHETPGATSSPRGEECAFQRPVAAGGVIIPHLPSTSSLPCLSQPLAVPSCPSCPCLPSSPPFVYPGAASHPFPTPHHSSGALPLPLPPCPPNGAGGEKEGLPGVPAALPARGGEGQEGAAAMRLAPSPASLAAEMGSSPGGTRVTRSCNTSSA